MQIQPAFNAGAQQGTTGVSFQTKNNGSTPGMLDGVRADWNVRMNLSHATGFVGGAGRLLVHNLVADERRELVLLLPAARAEVPGHLELVSATVCSAKPGLAANPGDVLGLRVEGGKTVVTIPLLQLNDWVYVDLTWTGGFAPGGVSYPGAQVPVGDFHPQIAVETTMDNGQPALAPVSARYDVELGSDVGATVRVDGAGDRAVVDSHPGTSPDGAPLTMHEFKSHGTARIDAFVVPAGALFG